jgi:hypothetical protein
MKQTLLLSILMLFFLVHIYAQENISCPNIKVVPVNKTYMPGDSIFFSVTLDEELKNLKLEYEWKTSDGELIQGQGTTDIVISSAGLHDLTIISTVEIKGLPQNCPNTFSGTAIVAKIPLEYIIIDHFHLENLDEIKVRVANFYTALNNHPTARGVIIIYGTKKEIAKREAEIRKAIRLGKYSKKRIEFIRDNRQPGVRTRFFVVPKGEKMPVP